MVWPFRRRKIGRHRLQSPQVGMVLPGVALCSYAPPEVGAAAESAGGGGFAKVERAAPVPPPHVRDAGAIVEPEVMPLPPRVVLTFADGSTKLIAPLSEDADRMNAAAERLMGVRASRA